VSTSRHINGISDESQEALIRVGERKGCESAGSLCQKSRVLTQPRGCHFQKTTARNFSTRLHSINDASAWPGGGFSDSLFKMKTPVKETQAILVRPRVYIGDDIALGPGKIDLLRAVQALRDLAN
jgi:hypothetical protein